MDEDLEQTIRKRSVERGMSVEEYLRDLLEDIPEARTDEVGLEEFHPLKPMKVRTNGDGYMNLGIPAEMEDDVPFEPGDRVLPMIHHGMLVYVPLAKVSRE